MMVTALQQEEEVLSASRQGLPPAGCVMTGKEMQGMRRGLEYAYCGVGG